MGVAAGGSRCGGGYPTRGELRIFLANSSEKRCEQQWVLTLKNRGLWGEARFGGTCGIEVGLFARGEMRILH